MHQATETHRYMFSFGGHADRNKCVRSNNNVDFVAQEVLYYKFLFCRHSSRIALHYDEWHCYNRKILRWCAVKHPIYLLH